MKLYRYKNLTGQDVEDKCRELFINNYIKDVAGNKVIIKTTNNELVIFKIINYDHAFSYQDKKYDSSNPRSKERKFSYQRARCILWIKEMVTGKNTGAIRKDIQQNVFFYDQKEKYVVILRKLKNGYLQFVTHFFVKNKKYLQKLEKKLLY